MFEQATIPRTLDERSTRELVTERESRLAGYREAAYALLRASLGVVFLVAGVMKIAGGVGNFEAGLEQQFSGKLPVLLLKPFGYALPFAEVIVGILLILGLFVVPALVICGLELLALIFGTALAGEHPVSAHNTQYALVNFFLLWFAGYNGYSVDRLLRRNRRPRWR
jgi:thiosulfate dehydrogenase [quinone] large subunit